MISGWRTLKCRNVVKVKLKVDDISPLGKLQSNLTGKTSKASLLRHLRDRYDFSAQVMRSIDQQLDLHEYMGGANIMPTSPHPITKEQVPLTLGHEFSGVIEEVGEDIKDIQIGQRVSVQPIIYDGSCGACRDGLINCCDNNGFVGLSGEFCVFFLGLQLIACFAGWGGGLSEHVVVPRAAVYGIPESVSMKVGGKISY